MKRTVFCVVGLLMGLFPPVLGAAASPGGNDGFELTPGVVVDPTSATVFMMNPDGGIDSVSVRSGELLWSSDQAAKPLAVQGDLLVAQVEKPAGVGGLEIALIDAVRGGDGGRTLRIDLPSGMYGAVDDGLGASFLARAVVRGGEPFVLWEHVERYMKGTAPESSDVLESRQVAAYRIDVGGNRAMAVDPGAVDALAPVWPEQVTAWAGAERASTPISRAGSVLAATELRDNGGRQEIVLKRWDATSGAALEDLSLFSGPHVAQLRSVDHRHLLVAERFAPGEFTEYEWSIFSLETGERLGQVSHHQSASWFFVTDSMLTYVENPYGRRVSDEWVTEERKLKTVLLGSATPVWERPLRDTSFKGAFPP